MKRDLLILAASALAFAAIVGLGLIYRESQRDTCAAYYHAHNGSGGADYNPPGSESTCMMLWLWGPQ